MILVCSALTILLGGCDKDLAPQDGQQAPLGREETRKTNFGKLFGDNFLFFGESKKFDANASTGMRVNPYLWQAALNVLSFMPLASADSSGGIIITDWYSAPDMQNERVKVTATINDRKLRADALNITIHKQVKGKNGTWSNVAVSPEIVTEMEDIILTKARELRISASKR